jgi:cell division protein FtsZ
MLYEGLKSLFESIDSLIIVPDTISMTILGNEEVMPRYLAATNSYIKEVVEGLVGLIRDRGDVEIDFSDVRELFSKSGIAQFGTATASGPNRAQIATEQAASFLLKEKNVHGVIINMTHDRSLSMREYKEVMTVARSRLSNEDAVVYVRASSNVDLSGSLCVTVFATGCKKEF